MTLISDGLHKFEHRVFQPEFQPETRHTLPRFMQIELTIDVFLIFIRPEPGTGNFGFFPSDTNPLSSQKTLRFDLNLLRNHDEVSRVLAPAFTRLGINTASASYDTIVREIIECGLKAAESTFKRRYNFEVLPLRSEIRAAILEPEDNNNNQPPQEEVSIGTDVAESAKEFESDDDGMVAAKESSVKEMVKRVRIEGGGEEDEEDCMICLEELKVGMVASRMPCSHTFHCSCIGKWLQRSHYCPICRFEMPTD